jgi:hypothetical protein
LAASVARPTHAAGSTEIVALASNGWPRRVSLG